MSRPVVWLAGPPGSGKTTAGRRSAERVGLPYRSAGDRFRSEARARGLSLEAFSRFAETHPEIDRDLDRALMSDAPPGAVLEGRVVGALLRRDGTPVYAVRIDAREEVRAARVAGRDGTDASTALQRIRERAESERKRYAEIYGIDPELERYDARLDTSDLDVEAATVELTTILRRAMADP